MIGLEYLVEDKEPSPSLVHKNHVDTLATSIGKDKEYWIEKVNDRLEKILRKEKRATNL